MTMDDMLKLFADFREEPGISMQRQVKSFIRSGIQDRRLEAGTRLPPMRELAAALGTNYHTVNRAITELVKEGFLQKVHSVGAFVNDRPQRLEKVGIYLHFEGQGKEEMLSGMRIQSALQIEMSRRNIECRMLLDPRPNEQRGTILPELANAIKTHAIEALIVLSPHRIMTSWLSRLPIPLAIATSSSFKNGVTYNCIENIRPIYDRCRELGCRSIGWISHVPCGGTYEETPTDSDFFQMVSREFNIELREEWMIVPSDWVYTGLMQYGYQAFRQFMALKERPEMLVLFPDTVALGCVNAIMESGIKIPEELKLLVCTNKEIPFDPPFPIDRMEHCCFDMAKGLLNQLERVRENQETSPMKLRAKLIKNAKVEENAVFFP